MKKLLVRLLLKPLVKALLDALRDAELHEVAEVVNREVDIPVLNEEQELELIAAVMEGIREVVVKKLR